MDVTESFRSRLLEWFWKNGRNHLPWRNTRDPYRILIAEIMLQRTRAEQVVPLYLSFTEKFPDMESLAAARREELEEYFSHLGLRWRVNKVIEMARETIRRFEGRIPEKREELLSIPAVGEYIADAVLAFAYGKKVAVLDSNVCRVIERVFSLKPRGEARRDPKFREMVEGLLPEKEIREYNFAIIDFASLVCLPRNPKSDTCPLKDICRKRAGT